MGVYVFLSSVRLILVLLADVLSIYSMLRILARKSLSGSWIIEQLWISSMLSGGNVFGRLGFMMSSLGASGSPWKIGEISRPIIGKFPCSFEICSNANCF